MNISGWDGRNMSTGKDQDMGVYTYTLTGTFIDGTQFEKIGNVTLIR